jgi:hypothetical protein
MNILHYKYLSVITFSAIGILLSLALFGLSLKAIQSLLCIAELSYFAFEDIKDRAITTLFAVISTLINLLFVFLVHGLDDLKSSIISLVSVSLTLLIVTFLSKQQLGIGDVLVISAVSVLIGWLSTAFLIAIALMLIFVYYIVHNIRHKEKLLSLPFVAFLLPAFNGILLFI